MEVRNGLVNSPVQMITGPLPSAVPPGTSRGRPPPLPAPPQPSAGEGSLIGVQLFGTPRTVARQAPLSMGFPRQEYCSGLLFPSRDLPDPGIKPTSPVSPALAGRLFTTEAQGAALDTEPLLNTSSVAAPSIHAPHLASVKLNQHPAIPTRDQQALSIATQTVNIFGFAGHLVCVAATQLCHRAIVCMSTVRDRKCK